MNHFWFKARSIALAERLRAVSFCSHAFSTTLYSSMVALASSTDEWPLFPVWKRKKSFSVEKTESLFLFSYIKIVWLSIIGFKSCFWTDSRFTLKCLTAELLKELFVAQVKMTSTVPHYKVKPTCMSLSRIALVSLFRDTVWCSGSPAFWFSSGIRAVSRVWQAGWKYFKALKSFWMAWPTTIFPFNIFKICVQNIYKTNQTITGLSVLCLFNLSTLNKWDVMQLVKHFN